MCTGGKRGKRRVVWLVRRYLIGSDEKIFLLWLASARWKLHDFLEPIDSLAKRKVEAWQVLTVI